MQTDFQKVFGMFQLSFPSSLRVYYGFAGVKQVLKHQCVGVWPTVPLGLSPSISLGPDSGS